MGGTEAPRSCDDLIAFAVGPNGDGLDESLGAEALSIMFRWPFCDRGGDVPHG